MSSDASGHGLLRLLQLAQERDALAQVLMPVGGGCGSTALLCGNLQLRGGMRREGEVVDDAGAAVQDVMARGAGAVVDLSQQMEALGIAGAATGEMEIKESWSHGDELLLQTRARRLARGVRPGREAVRVASSRLPEDIDALLAAAEAEELDGDAGAVADGTGPRRVKEIRDLVRAEQRGPLPAATARPVISTALLGDVVERVTTAAPVPSEPASGLVPDETSAKVILNEMLATDLKRSSLFKSSRRENK